MGADSSLRPSSRYLRFSKNTPNKYLHSYTVCLFVLLFTVIIIIQNMEIVNVLLFTVTHRV